MGIKKGIDVKLNVQPVFGMVYHEYIFEGPCRFGTGDQLTEEYDRMAAASAFKTFEDAVAEYMNAPYLNVLPTLRFELNEEFNFTDELIDPIAKGAEDIDVYLITSTGRVNYGLLSLAQKTGKPIISLQFCCNATTSVAMLKNRGFEAYSFTTWERAADFLRIMRVRKVLKTSNIMLLTRGNSNFAAASASDGFISLEEVTKNIGPGFRFVDVHEFIDQTKHIARQEKYDETTTNYTLPGRVALNIDDCDLAEIEKTADTLLSGAEEVSIEKKYVMNSVRANVAARKLMCHLGCNAMAAPCPEMCATRRLNKEQFTMCLNHSLNNEAGIPSACEYDVPGVIAMLLLSNLSFSAPYLGNTVSVTTKADGVTPLFNMVPYNGLDKKLPKFDAETRKNLMLTFHSVANRKLKGFDAEEGSYTLRPFTGSGWGATMRHNFDDDIGQIITMARVSPDAKSIFVARGEIVGTVGYELSGCTHGVLFKVKDREDFFAKQLSFGNHCPLVYGDYLDDVKAVAKLIGLNVVEA